MSPPAPSTLDLLRRCVLAVVLLVPFGGWAAQYCGGEVEVESLSYSSGAHAVYLWRRGERIKATYFAVASSGQTVYQAYEAWKSSHPKYQIVAVCSGAFSGAAPAGQNAVPVGLTVQDGVPKNMVVDPVMDGLVVVYSTGGLAVSNLDKGDLWLESLGRKVNARSTTDKIVLLDWAKNQRATLFQTQLLAYANELTLDTTRATRESRERRLLALVKQADGIVGHVIIDIKAATLLGTAASQALGHLKARGLTVVALLNLDTGTYDALEVTPEGKGLAAPKGTQSIQQATNLLVYYFEGT